VKQAAVILISALCSWTLPAQTPAALQDTIARLARGAGGTVGVAVVHVESGQSVSLNGDGHFPMASVYKFPIAIQVLYLVDQGKLTLEQTVKVAEGDLRAGHTPIGEKYPHGGAALSVRELLRYMVSESDNTACDLLLRLSGGPAATFDRMRTLGFININVSQSEAQIAADYAGRHSLQKNISPAEKRAAGSRWSLDLRDSASPDAMAGLLVKTQRGQIGLKPASLAYLLELMTNSPTGPHRIKGLLPAGTPVAHKTGTYGGTANFNALNDVGIITLPGQAGHLAIAVFVKVSARPEAVRERAIAEISKAAFNYWNGKK
jgi:beta-lactamase class A